MLLEKLSGPIFHLVLLLGMLTILLVLVVRRFRDGAEEEETTSAILAKFREMHYQGELSEAEFRTIKTILAEKLQAELKQKGDSS